MDDELVNILFSLVLLLGYFYMRGTGGKKKSRRKSRPKDRLPSNERVSGESAMVAGNNYEEEKYRPSVLPSVIRETRIREERSSSISRLEGHHMKSSIETRKLQSNIEKRRLKSEIEERKLSLRVQAVDDEIHIVDQPSRASEAIKKLPDLKEIIIYDAILNKPKGLS